MLITYPVTCNFPGSGMFLQKAGPTSESMLEEIYGWLEAHSAFTHLYGNLLIAQWDLEHKYDF